MDSDSDNNGIIDIKEERIIFIDFLLDILIDLNSIDSLAGICGDIIYPLIDLTLSNNSILSKNSWLALMEYKSFDVRNIYAVYFKFNAIREFLITINDKYAIEYEYSSITIYNSPGMYINIIFIYETSFNYDVQHIMWKNFDFKIIITQDIIDHYYTLNKDNQDLPKILYEFAGNYNKQSYNIYKKRLLEDMTEFYVNKISLRVADIVIYDNNIQYNYNILKSFQFLLKSIDFDKTCSICYELEIKCQLVCFKCCTTYCLPCIEKYNSNKCPYCRTINSTVPI